MSQAQKSYGYAQLEAVAQEMRADPTMVFYYEYSVPVSTMPDGTVLDLRAEFGEPRTSGSGWPIDEQWIVGAAIGAATAGSKAIARLPSMAQLYALEYVYNQAGKIRSMTGGQASMPFVLWVDGARRGRGSAGQHTDVGVEAIYANLPGIKVVCPSNAYDAKGLLISAIRDPDPVVYMNYPRCGEGLSRTCRTRRTRFPSERPPSAKPAAISPSSRGRLRPSMWRGRFLSSRKQASAPSSSTRAR